MIEMKRLVFFLHHTLHVQQYIQMSRKFTKGPWKSSDVNPASLSSGLLNTTLDFISIPSNATKKFLQLTDY